MFTLGVFVFDSFGDIYYLTDEKNMEFASFDIIITNLINTSVILTVVTIFVILPPLLSSSSSSRTLSTSSSTPVGLQRCPWARYQGQLVHSDTAPSVMARALRCDVGVKTVNSPLGINDVCFFFFFLYQAYHPHHPQHPHYLVNPPHPHQILLLLPPFIILQPSKIIRRKCWSPGDHSLSRQEQAQTVYEHVDTYFWHTLELHSTEPRYESWRGELDQPEISLFHFDLQYDLVFPLIVLTSFCSQWIMLFNQLRFLTQIFHSSSSCRPRPPFLYLAASKGNSGKRLAQSLLLELGVQTKNFGSSLLLRVNTSAPVF